ncbi:MAG: hypothetical protein CTY36_18285, partial [Methylocystis sp.]
NCEIASVTEPDFGLVPADRRSSLTDEEIAHFGPEAPAWFFLRNAGVWRCPTAAGGILRRRMLRREAPNAWPF